MTRRYRRNLFPFYICLLLTAALLSSCGKQAESNRISFDDLMGMDGDSIDETLGDSSVHAVLSIPVKEALKEIVLALDEERAETIGLQMDEDGYADYEQFKVLTDGVWKDSLPPNCSFAGDEAQSRKFGYVSDIQAEGVAVSPEEAARETEDYMREVTGSSFQAYRVITSNPYKEGNTGEYWVWLMLNLYGIPIHESPGEIGIVAKYSPQGVYAYYGRFLFRKEAEKMIDTFENPQEIAGKFLKGGFGRCEKIELVYVLDSNREERTLIPAWAFYVQDEEGLKAYEYSANDGSLLNVRDMAMMW